MPALPSPRPQPGSVGAHPGQRSPSVSQPHPFSSQPEAGPSHQGARFPGARGAVGKLPKVPREALVLPHLKPATAARQVPMCSGWRSPRAERGHRDSTRLCWASALGPSRAGWARGPAPAPSRVAPPRPARPRPSGGPFSELPASWGGHLGRVSEICACLSLWAISYNVKEVKTNYILYMLNGIDR